MAIIQTQLSANELAWAADDKPFFSGNVGITSARQWWVTGTINGNFSSPNNDATGFEAYRAFDGLPGRVTKPSSASTLFTLIFDWSASPIAFDWIGVMNHNLYTLACTDLTLQLATASDFASGQVTMSTIDVSTSYSADRRMTDLVLNVGGVGSANRYSNVPYGRFKITCSSGVPEIGQVILGRRRQQKHAPSIPWDPTNETSTMYQLDSPGGVRKRTAKRKGRREIQATFKHQAGWPALSGYTNFESDVGSWWKDIRCGKEPFYWIDEPNSNPDDFWMFKADPAITYPHLNATSREFTIKGVEQGPQAQYFSQGP